ncbi:MAG: CHASE domain-containing protein [Magnetococcales bacterium]|nr:CHASE domain-containing protein [Magnetococcales bacterium]
MQSQKPQSRQDGFETVQIPFSIRNHISAILVLLAGLALTAVVHFTLLDQREEENRRDLEIISVNYQQRIAGALRQAFDTLYGMRFLYIGSHHVSRQEFHTAAADALTRIQGIQALQWAPLVTDAQRQSMERQTADHFPGYHFTERSPGGKRVPAEKRPHYVPVHYLHPIHGNQAALGFDLAANPALRKTMEMARDSGSLTVSGHLKLVQESGDQYGFLAYVPVYQVGAPSTSITERRAAIKGYLLGVFRIGDLVEAAIASLEPNGLDFMIQDSSTSKEPYDLYLHRSRIAGASPHLTATPRSKEGARHAFQTRKEAGVLQHTLSIPLPNRTWRVTIRTTPQFQLGGHNHVVWPTTLSGLLLTLLVTMHLVRLKQNLLTRSAMASQLDKSRERLDHKVRERTTELEQSNTSLWASEKMLRLVMDQVPQRIYWKDRDLNYLGCDESYARDAGLTAPDEIIGQCDYDLPWRPAEAKQARADDRTIMKAGVGRIHVVELQKMADGRHLWLETSKSPLKNRQGEVVGILGTYQDVTQRIETEQALKESRESLAKAQRIAGIGNWEWHTADDRHTWSEEMFNIFNIDPHKQPLYHDLLSAIHPGDRLLFDQRIHNTIQSGESYEIEIKVMWPGGMVRDVHALGERVTNPEDDSVVMLGTVQDITDRKRDERTILHLNQQNNMLLTAAGEGIYGINPEGVITFINPAAEKMVGWSAHEITGRSQHHLFFHSDAEGAPIHYLESPVYATLTSGDAQKVSDALFWKRDGDSFPAEYTCTPMYRDLTGTHNRITGAVVVFRDITIRNQLAQKEQRATQARKTINALLHFALESKTLSEQLDQALAMMLEGAWITTKNKGAIFLYNEASHKLEMIAQRQLSTPLLTLCKEINVGQCLCGRAAESREIVFADHVDDHHDIRFEGMSEHGHYCIPMISHGRMIGVINLYLEADQKRDPEEESFLHMVANTLAGLIEHSRMLDLLHQRQKEITDLNASLAQRVQGAVEKNRQMDVMLVQQSRLAAMGEMIGNIAHQWRQPINSLNLILANIQSAYDYDELTGEILDEKVETGQQIILNMSSTIDDFRNFFKPDKKKRSFDMEKMIQDACSLVQASLSAHQICVELVGPKHPITTWGFPNEYSQVALLILTNAKDAIVENKLPSGRIHIKIEARKEQAIAEFSDNGGGIPNDIMERIFDPYFTTKGAKKGTGIGLYMAKIIIEDHMKGTIRAVNRDHGASFQVSIPIIAEAKSE